MMPSYYQKNKQKTQKKKQKQTLIESIMNTAIIYRPCLEIKNIYFKQLL